MARPARFRFLPGAAFALGALLLLFVTPGRAVPEPPLTPAAAFAGATPDSYLAGDGQTSLALWIFPAAHSAKSEAPPTPAILFFAGSGWIRGWITQFSPYARALAARGITALCADYRTQSSASATPFDAMEDAARALRWVHAHARELNVDPSRVAVAGASSGGQLALWLGCSPPDDVPSPAAVVGFSAITDTGVDGYPEGVALFSGRGRDASPLLHLRPGLPPTLLLHGEADSWVPAASAARYVEASRQLGNRVRLVRFAGRGHAFFNDASYRPGVRPDDFATCLFLVDDFLSSLGWIARPERIETSPTTPVSP